MSAARFKTCVSKTLVPALALIGVLGGLPLLLEWHSSSPVQFLTYLVLGLLTSGWKVTLPGVQGTLSANSIFVILSILELSPGESLVVGGASVLFQYAWRATSRLRLLNAAFNVSAIWMAIRATDRVIHSRTLEVWSFDLPLRLALASCVYFLANTIPIAMAISVTEGKGLFRTWRDCFFWSFPFYVVGAAFAGCLHLLNGVAGRYVTILIVPIIYFVHRYYSLYLGRLQTEKERAEVQQRHAEEVASLHLRTIEALALAIDAKDETTHKHLKRVQVYCIGIGSRLGLGDDEMQALQAASLLHDIGKLAVPEHIISKPGKLTPEEFEKVKIHPIVGAEILERVKFPYPVVPIVRHHHEQWDGLGYPDGLKGEEIPIGARILAAVDCLDALASDRQYRRALPLPQAMAVVAGESRKRYDPRIVELLSQHYQELEEEARNIPSDMSLSRNVKVERGLRPAAGFEPFSQDSNAAEFVHSIGAARQEAQVLFDVTQILSNSLSLPQMLEPLADCVRRLIPFDTFVLYLIRQDLLIPEFVRGAESALFSSLAIPMGGGLSGWVAENQAPILNGNPSVEPGYLNDPSKFSVQRSALAVPLEGSEGVVGTLSLYSSQGEAFHHDHSRILLSISSRLSLALENSIRYQQAADEATTDFLTRLLNARSLFARLERDIAESRRQSKPLTVVICDLDGFKQVNDQFGHIKGNQVLEHVGAVLRRCSRQDDYAARMGGDEFVIVLSGAGLDKAASLAERLRDAVDTSIVATFGAQITSFSIGFASFPEEGADVKDLLAEADRRMYLDKQARKTAPQDLTTLSHAVEPGEYSVRVN